MPSDKPPEQADAREIAGSCICFAARQATRVVTQHFDRILKPAGIRSTQLALLNALSLMGPVSFKKLARTIGMDRTTLARNLKPLVRQGMVHIRTGRDLREREASLTAHGRGTLAVAFPLWNAAQDRIKENLGDETMRVLMEGLSKLAALRRRNG